jgi:hypothetical protein
VLYFNNGEGIRLNLNGRNVRASKEYLAGSFGRVIRQDRSKKTLKEGAIEREPIDDEFSFGKVNAPSS